MTLLGKLVAAVLVLTAVSAVLREGKKPEPATPAPAAPASPVAQAPEALPAASSPAPASPPARLQPLRKSVDEIERITWHEDARAPRAVLKPNFALYIGETASSTWLRMALHYYGERWLFVDKAVVVVDGEKVIETVGSWDRDIGSLGNVWEMHDTRVPDEKLHLLRRAAAGSVVVVRFYGSRGTHDLKLSKAALSAMANVLAHYDQMPKEQHVIR